MSGAPGPPATRRSLTLRALAALGDSLDRDHWRLLLDLHLVTPSPCSREWRRKFDGSGSINQNSYVFLAQFSGK
jgi:hypothetical protein